MAPTHTPHERGDRPEILFYDGTCGLCHRTVRFLLAKDRDGSRFRFAPLQGKHFSSLVTPEQRRSLPDSLVLRTSDGTLLTRSRAVRHALLRLGGAWGVAARMAVVVPPPVADWCYDLVARFRRRMFAPPAEACPIVPPDLRGRFITD